jgi:hypothetical protein
MDNFLHQPEPQTKQASRSSASLNIIFHRILNWLAKLIQLTEEEQKDAGLYLGDQHYNYSE